MLFGEIEEGPPIAQIKTKKPILHNADYEKMWLFYWLWCCIMLSTEIMPNKLMDSRHRCGRDKNSCIGHVPILCDR